jgi:hypothetical protein
MHRSITLYRRDAPTFHPPYGLYFDPHHGQHNWTAATSRLLLGLLAVLGSIVAVAALGPRLG